MFLLKTLETRIIYFLKIKKIEELNKVRVSFQLKIVCQYIFFCHLILTFQEKK